MAELIIVDQNESTEEERIIEINNNEKYVSLQIAIPFTNKVVLDYELEIKKEDISFIISYLQNCL